MIKDISDFYRLGKYDWRFLLAQYVSGLFFNRSQEKKQYDSCLIDKFESAPVNLVSIVLINGRVDTDTVFSKPEQDPDLMLDIDIVIQSLTEGVR